MITIIITAIVSFGAGLLVALLWISYASAEEPPITLPKISGLPQYNMECGTASELMMSMSEPAPKTSRL